MDVTGLALMHLPDELLLVIFAFLDVCDLLSISRTCHRNRALSLDPVLHAHRLQLASLHLSQSLRHRPSLASLLPPASTIYLSQTTHLARALSRKLVAIRLGRNLARRPSPTSLIHANILPEEYCRRDPATGALLWGGALAPAIISAKRRVERERLKDALKAWLLRKASKVAGLERCGAVWDGAGVRALVQRFTGTRKSGLVERGGADNAIAVAVVMTEERWGRGAHERRRCEPARAKVLGLRRFWEGLAGGTGEVRA